MTDFDNLIKEKAEQAEFSYKASAWKSFAAKAGIKTGLTALQWGAVVVSALLVAGGITLGVVKHQSQQPAAQPEVTEIAVEQDTVETVPDNMKEENVQPLPEVQPKSVKPAAPVAKPEPQIPEETAAPAPKPVKQKTPKRKTERYYGRPVRISVDTITQFELTKEQIDQGHSRIINN
ncbi:MAG: hypothetical protein MJZ87_05485 [Bacteroidales bacterium]|nr:hypothetical protein [Bacteroidales bacterium]